MMVVPLSCVSRVSLCECPGDHFAVEVASVSPGQNLPLSQGESRNTSGKTRRGTCSALALSHGAPGAFVRCIVPSTPGTALACCAGRSPLIQCARGMGLQGGLTPTERLDLRLGLLKQVGHELGISNGRSSCAYRNRTTPRMGRNGQEHTTRALLFVLIMGPWGLARPDGP
jgi:hypothetical protein